MAARYYHPGANGSSPDDSEGIRKLIGDTVDLIADERVRVFCVAAQVVDVEQKIDQAITEVMRLGAHAIRTAMVPLPASGLIGTPTVSRILCEHVMQCFGFPKATPEAVEEIMSQVVTKNLKSFMRVSLTQFASISAITLGAAIPSGGIGVIAGIAGCILSTPPTARMLLKCACDMILILERSFRYQGKYVSVKQLEDAAAYYTTAMTKKLDGTPILLQQNIHQQIDNMIPLKKVGIGFKFGTLRSGLQDIIYLNRYDKESQSQVPSRVSSNQVHTPSRLPSLDKPNTPTPPPPAAETWRDWKGETVESTPTWQGQNGNPTPVYRVADPEANMKFLGATPFGRPIAELDSNPAVILPHPAKLEGTSISNNPAAVAELAGDYGLPHQTHPDYAPSLRHGIHQMPSMRLAGTLYTPADDPTVAQQWPRSNPSDSTMGVSTPDIARSPSNLSPSTEDLAIRKKKSSSSIFKKLRLKKS